MQRLSIARSLRLALTGLTVILAVVAAVGVASLNSSRQSYENTLLRSSQLAVASANLTSADLVEQEVDRLVHGRQAGPARRAARAAYAAAAARTLSLAGGDPQSQALVRAQIAQRSSRPAALAAAAALQRRQSHRQAQARARARSDSRREISVMIVAGGLAVLAALVLIASLIRSMRNPLDSLVVATRRVAEGELSQRVPAAGPAELRELSISFNAMAAKLAVATERIEHERARLATTIESLGDGLLVTSASSSAVVTANPRAAELVPELEPGAATDGPDSPLPSLEEAEQAEIMIEHADRTLAVTAAPMVLGGSQAGVVWTVRDVSERARLERAKSDFVATASHELRSPLTSIKGFIELLANAPGAMTERQQEFVSIIARSTDRLVDLVNDLLDVARLEADHVEIKRRAVDAAQAVREVVELIGPRVEAKSQQLECELAPGLPLTMADPGRLRQIVANLVTNAHLYTPEGGRIVVSAVGDGPWVRLTVSDSGVGMTPEEVEHVFERFHRGARDTGSPGTGLGLSIVKSLVDLHEGRVEVESEPGAGTTFTVLIPSAIGALGLAPTVEALRGRRVLVVDDERDIAQLIADQLAPFGVDCTIAEGGQAALERLAAATFDAITLDIKMPRVGGFDVLRRIRADPELSSLPIVFVSVFSDHHDLVREWVVSKPIDADELREVLGAAVTSGRSRVLVVGREEVRHLLAPSLAEMRIEYQWETTGGAASRVCSERRFEVALVDVGLRNPQAVLQALDLRGRRLRRAVILFTDGTAPPTKAIQRLGLEVVPIERAAQALVRTLQTDRAKERWLPADTS
jgi:signal transduction histidine kinase/DNA-binding response OmpR family regulator/HAMP domain-containing protein